MRLHEILLESTPKTFVKPNYKIEFDELQMHNELKNVTEEEWKKWFNTGGMISLNTSSDIFSGMKNTEANDPKFDFEKLETEKKKRVKKIFKDGRIEAPIVIKNGSNYTLLAGNTRLTYAVQNDFKPKIWLINSRDLKVGKK